MDKFHPSIKIRLENLGRGYETLALKVFDFNKEAGQFFADLKKQMELCQDQNNRQLILEKEEKLSPQKLEERMIKLTRLAETAQNYEPDFAALSYATKPYTDAILAFREILVAEMQKLADNSYSREESEIIMANLEKKFAPLYKDFDVCRNNLNNCLSDFEEMKKLYSEIEG